MVNVNSKAQDAFDTLINNKLDFILAVDEDKTVKGIVTKTSMVKALAEVVWKGADNE